MKSSNLDSYSISNPKEFGLLILPNKEPKLKITLLSFIRYWIDCTCSVQNPGLQLEPFMVPPRMLIVVLGMNSCGIIYLIY